MKLPLLALLTIAQALVAAQHPQPFAWLHRDGTNGGESPRSIAVDSQGNVVIGGGFTGNGRFGTNGFSSPGRTSGFLAKYDRRGSNLWARAFQGSGVEDDIVQGVAVDPDGFVYVAGDFTDTTDFGGVLGTSSGSNDLFAAKFDPDGNLVWLFAGGGAGRDSGFALGLDAATNVSVAGMFRGTSTYGGTDVVGAGGATDFLLLKLNPAGQMSWVLRGGGTGSDETRALTVDAAGNSYVAGVFGGTANFSGSNLVSAGGLDAMVLKYDTLGNLLWAFTGGGTAGDEAKSLAVDRSGDVLFNGYFNDTAQFGTNQLVSNGVDDIFTARLDRDGRLVWIRTGGGAGDDSGRGIAVDLEGNVYTTGWVKLDATFDGVSMTNLTSGTGNDIPLLKYDRDGQLQWVQRFGGSGGDQAWDLASDPLGNIYLTGQFALTASFGWTNLTSAGNADLCWGKLVSVTPPPLAIELGFNHCELRWDVRASEFRLESAPDLGGSTLWTNYPAPPIIVSNSNVVAAPLTESRQYYRLNWP